MPDLEDFASDVDAIRNGAWEAPGEAWGDMELLVRGFGPSWTEKLNAAQATATAAGRRKGVIKTHQEYKDLPLKERNDLANALLLKHIFIDVRNLSMGGKPVTAAQYREYAMMEQYEEHLITAVWVAARSVSDRRAAVGERAVGNSQTSSDTNSTGDHDPTS